MILPWLSRSSFHLLCLFVCFSCGGKAQQTESDKTTEQPAPPDGAGGASVGLSGSAVARSGRRAVGVQATGGDSNMGTGGVASLEVCDELRVGALAHYHSLLDAARVCSSSDECHYVTFGNDCGLVCPHAVSQLHLSSLGESFLEYGEKHCGELQCWQHYPSACPVPPSSVACVNGLCEYSVAYEPAGKYASKLK